LPADEAYKLATRFEVHYTPKSASWLNMIEIEFSALSKQCLNRRIHTQDKLESEINAIVKERNEKKIKINWQFSIKIARNTMNSKYSIVNQENLKFKTT
jgi:recombinational DNA repair ATPase RecF